MQAGGRVGEGSPVREQGWTQQGHQESSLCLPPPATPRPTGSSQHTTDGLSLVTLLHVHGQGLACPVHGGLSCLLGGTVTR